MLNLNEHAIQSIVTTIESYAPELPCFGFGARLSSDEDASKDFHLTMDDDKPVCTGVKCTLP